MANNKQYDFELIRDIYVLLHGNIARCRLSGQSIDETKEEERKALSDKSLLFVNNYNIMIGSQKPKVQEQDLDILFYNLQMLEIKGDIKEA